MPIPRLNDTMEVWRQFVQQEDWHMIYAIYGHFVPRLYAPHDEEVWKLLFERLWGFEQSVLSEDFLVKNTKLIIRVEDNASAEQIKNKVRNNFFEPYSPQYVVGKNGKLRGFALSEDLIIVGVTSVSTFRHYLLERVKSLGGQLLTRTDSRIVEKNLPVLIERMKEADVPSLENVNFWMLAQRKGQPRDLSNVMVWKDPAGVIVLSIMIFRYCWENCKKRQ